MCARAHARAWVCAHSHVQSHSALFDPTDYIQPTSQWWSRQCSQHKTKTENGTWMWAIITSVPGVITSRLFFWVFAKWIFIKTGTLLEKAGGA